MGYDTKSQEMNSNRSPAQTTLRALPGKVRRRLPRTLTRWLAAGADLAPLQRAVADALAQTRSYRPPN